MTVLKWKPRKSLLELNQEEIERATVERINLTARLRKLSGDIAALYLERERLCRELRKR